MKTSSIVAVLALGFVLADPAMAQSSRAKDDSRRVSSREPASADRNERDRGDQQRADARRPIRQTVHANQPDRDDDRWDDWNPRRPIIIVRPDRRHDPRYYDPMYDGARYYGSTYSYGSRYGAGGATGGVWNRHPGMTCLRLDDELEWAHDEWHYRNDRHEDARWYEAEHARLEWRIAEERAYSGCGRARATRDCDERGHSPVTASRLGVAVLVLDILLGDGRWHGDY